MKQRWILMIALLLSVLAAAACSGAPAPTPAPPRPTAEPARPVTAATEAPAQMAAANASACEDYFGFCVSARASGALTATGRGGWGSSTRIDCKAWAAGGETRILELPQTLSVGDQQITVALTRIGAYTGPGAYPLAATTTGGAMPDMFPTVRIGNRAFQGGADTTATVTILADGSGTLAASNLVELDAMQGVTPDPNARLDFTMQWTCQGKQ